MIAEGLEYSDFRTGLSFREVRLILKLEADKKYENGEYMWITRATILGRWRQIKLEMYEEYLEWERLCRLNNIKEFRDEGG